eukprot:jgi/Chrpa1/21120/Chrysochromulina_OHIO_Genome00008500-RA
MDVLRIYDAMPSRRPPPPSAGFRAMSPKAAQSNNPYHKVGVAGAGRVAFDKFESHNQGTAPVAESMAATRMLTVKTRTGFVKRAPVKVVASAAVAMPATTNAATVMAGSITWARTWSPPTCEQGHVTASQSSQAFKAGFQKQVPSASAEHARYSPNRPILTLDAYPSTVKAPSVQPWKPEQPVIAEGGMPVITEYDVPNGRIKPHLDGGHTRIIDVNRLSVAAVKTSGDEQVRKLRLECKQPLETLMRLQHVVLNFGGSSTSEEALKLPQGGSEVLAAVNGTIECVGELLPGWKPTPEQCYDDAAFVARVLRRRMRLDLPECWLRIDPRTHGSPLQVQLKAMGIFLDLHVRPSAMTPLVYCCSPETRLRVISPKNPPDGHTSSLRGRVSKRVGTVERVREDGVAVIRFDGDSEGTSMDLRSPLRVFEENPPIERKIATASPTTGLAMNAAAVFLQRQFRRRMGPRLVREKEQEQAAGIIGRACRKANSNKKKKWEDELAKKREDQLAAFEAQTREGSKAFYAS